MNNGDLISREALLQRIGEKLNILRGCNDYKEAWGMKYAMVMIQNAPAVDAVPVIRCQNCEHFAEFRAEAKKNGADGTCRRLLMKVVENDFSGVRATDFCSYGERKE